MSPFTRSSFLLLLILLVAQSLRVTAQVPPTWVRALQLGGPSTDQVSHTITDAAGNVYQVGTFFQTIQVGNKSLSVGPMASYDMYLVKSDPTGNVLWARQAGTMTNGSAYGAAEGNQLALDAAGNVYVAGSFVGGVTFGSAATTLTTTSSSFSVFLAKFTSQGAAVWAQQALTTGTGFGTGLAVAANGDVFLSGSFYNTITFGTTILASQTVNLLDGFVARYSAAGALQWVRLVSGPSNDYGSKVVLGPNDGVYLAGEFTGSLTLGTLTATGYGNSDCFLAQYSSQGTAQWVQAWGGADNDYLRDLALAPTGDVYAAGAFTGFATFGTVGLLGQGGTDGFILKCNPQGATSWAKQLGGTGNDYATALLAHPTGALYVAGRFTGTATIAGQSLVSAGGMDIFLARYNQAGADVWAVRGGGVADEFTGGLGYGAGGVVEVGVQFSGTAQFGGLTLTSRGQSDVLRCQLQDNTPLAQRNAQTADQLTISPNPATESSIQLIGLSNSSKITALYIRDVLGRVVARPALNATVQVGNTVSVEVEGLANGNYFLELVTDDGVLLKKLSVKR